MFMKKINKTTRSYYSSLVIKVFSALMGIAADNVIVVDEILTDLAAKVGKKCRLYSAEGHNSYSHLEIGGWIFDAKGRFLGRMEKDGRPTFHCEAYRKLIEKANDPYEYGPNAIRRFWAETAGQRVDFIFDEDTNEVCELLLYTRFGDWEFDKDGNLLGEWDEIDQECWEEQARTDLN